MYTNSITLVIENGTIEMTTIIIITLTKSVF